MVWLDYAIGERFDGKEAPPPEPLHPETSWWHRVLSDKSVNVAENIQLFEKQSTASGDMSLIVYHRKIVVPPQMRKAMVWHAHRELFHRGKAKSNSLDIFGQI